MFFCLFCFVLGFFVVVFCGEGLGVVCLFVCFVYVDLSSLLFCCVCMCVCFLRCFGLVCCLHNL